MDPVTKIISGSLNDVEDMSRLTDKADELAAKFRCAIVMIGHIRKPQNEEDHEGLWNLENELIGSSALADWADTMISLQLTDGDREVHVQFEKVRHSHILVPPRHVIWDRTNLKPTVTPCTCRRNGQQ
jgi:RecA-family ATPase